jgi:hypothetical protein
MFWMQFYQGKKQIPILTAEKQIGNTIYDILSEIQNEK